MSPTLAWIAVFVISIFILSPLCAKIYIINRSWPYYAPKTTYKELLTLGMVGFCVLLSSIGIGTIFILSLKVIYEHSH